MSSPCFRRVAGSTSEALTLVSPGGGRAGECLTAYPIGSEEKESKCAVWSTTQKRKLNRILADMGRVAFEIIQPQ